MDDIDYYCRNELADVQCTVRCLVFSKFRQLPLSRGQVPIIGALNERVRKKGRGVEGTITNLTIQVCLRSIFLIPTTNI